MIGTFNQETFEANLPRNKKTGASLCFCNGLVEGEYEYYMPIDAKSGIVIRSSIGRDGWSADSGEDSIRAWLIDETGKPLGSKVSRWVTRVNGWPKRLEEVLRILWTWRKTAGDCPICNKPKSIFKVVKSGPTHGRVFCKCSEHNGFIWLS